MSLIVFEGIDGSGKSTQFKLLCDHMDRAGTDYRRLVFPQYDQPSSALLRMYLEGQFGDDPEAVNPYATSTFYAVDRYASYVKVWGGDYRRGRMVLADRYTTSNAVHQGSKVEGEARREFFHWLSEFEYGRMELPRPDIVLYMDVPLDISLANMQSRQRETGTGADIHEAHADYLEKCLRAAGEAADFYGWRKISCAAGGKMRPPEDIHREILGILFP